MMKKEVIAIFDRDTKNKHRFLIQEKEDITGTVYIRKDQKVPDIVKVFLKTKGELEKESSQPGTTKKVKNKARSELQE
jgi:hypothetical protein